MNDHWFGQTTLLQIKASHFNHKLDKVFDRLRNASANTAKPMTRVSMNYFKPNATSGL